MKISLFVHGVLSVVATSMLVGRCVGLKILVYPFGITRNSHSIHMEKMAELLAENGHDVHVLVSETYTLPHRIRQAGVKIIVFKVNTTEVSQDQTRFTSLDAYLSMSPFNLLSFVVRTMYTICEMLLRDNKSVLERLQHETYDLLIFDSFDKCVEAISSYLDRPLISYHSQGLSKVKNPDIPEPRSYIPLHLTDYTDQMTFYERMVNDLKGLMMIPVRTVIYSFFNSLASKYSIEVKDKEIMRFIYDDFAVAFLQPIMPDMVLMGGAFIEPPSQLSTELESFVQSSGDNGVVVFSFGSILKDYGVKWTEVFAEAFARLPQKVLWRYSGKPPRNLGANTKLASWLPQTDLLAHPKTRAFITHCGMNSAYEAAFFGIPVVALPLGADQPHQATKLCDHHKMGVKLDLRSMTIQSLIDAIQNVISNPKYKENAMIVSRRFQAHQRSAKEKILFWVDYAGHNNGSDHLISNARKLPLHKYLLLDVYTFCIVVIIAGFYVIYTILKSLYKKVCLRKAQKSESKDKND